MCQTAGRCLSVLRQALRAKQAEDPGSHPSTGVPGFQQERNIGLGPRSCSQEAWPKESQKDHGPDGAPQNQLAGTLT